MSMEIEKNESLHAHGIVIPCSHYNPNECELPSSFKKIQVRLIFDVCKTLVYYPKNGRELVSTQKAPHSKTHLINPFCPFCRSIIDGYHTSPDDELLDLATEQLELLKDEVWKKFEIIKLQHNDDDDENQFENFDYRIIRFPSGKIICDEEEFRARVSSGNKYISERKIPLIKGLKKVVPKDLGKYLKRDNTCIICLENLKIVDKKEEDDAKINIAPATEIDIYIGLATKSLVKLRCEHVFHEPCILRWLHKNPICPCCRYALP